MKPILILIVVLMLHSTSSAQNFGMRQAHFGAAVAQPNAETVENYRQYFGIGIATGFGLPDFVNFTVMLNLNESFAIKGAFGILNSIQLEYRLPSDGRTVDGLVIGFAFPTNSPSGLVSNLNAGLEFGLTRCFWGPGAKDRIPVVLAGGGFGTVTLVTDFQGVIFRMTFGFMIGIFFQ